MKPEHVDVLIVGAGLSGIGAAYHLQKKCPAKTYAILEARDGIGGTWDLFRYPGVRSDSDMYTLGYRSSRGQEAKAIADGPSILTYIRETAREHGIDRKIRFDHRVEARVVVDAGRALDGRSRSAGPAAGDGAPHLQFPASCAAATTDYAAGYLPDFPGVERFKGRIVHPQNWTDDLDYAGKRVVVIGSGATAVTLVPAMAETGGARHHAAALADLRRGAARPGCDRQLAAPPSAAQARLRDRRAGRTCCSGMYFYQPVQAQARAASRA